MEIASWFPPTDLSLLLWDSWLSKGYKLSRAWKFLDSLGGMWVSFTLESPPWIARAGWELIPD